MPKASAARNSTFNLMAFLISGLVNLFYAPFLVRSLGMEVYGIIPVVLNLFVFATWASLAVNWSIGRYITIEYTQGEMDAVNEIFNTSFWFSVTLGLAIMGIGLIISQQVTSLLKIPTSSLKSVQALILLTSASTSLMILSAPAESAFYCLNRFDYRSSLQVGRTFVMIGMVWALFRFISPRLDWVGVGALSASALYLVLASIFSRRMIPAFRIRIRGFRPNRCKEMFSTNTWVLIDQLGGTMMVNLNIVLANRLFGPVASAQYGLASQWENVAKSVLSSLLVFNPIFVELFARKDIKGMRALAIHSSRAVGCFAGMATGVLMGHALAIPRIWLHNGNQRIGPMIIGFCLPVLLYGTVQPLFGIIHATNKVKIPALVTLGSGAMTLTVSAILAKVTHLGLWALLLGAGIALTLRNLAFTVYYAARLIQVARLPLLKNVAINTLGGLVTAAIGFTLTRWLRPNSWLMLGTSMVLTTLLVSPLYYFFFSDQAIRTKLGSMIRSKLAWMPI